MDQKPSSKFFRSVGLVSLALSSALLFNACSTWPGSGSKSTLWQITGAHNSVYLMGSIHVLPASAYPLRPALQVAFNKSQRVVFEVDLNTVSQQAVLREFEEVGVYPPGDSLEHHVSRQTIKLVKQVLANLGISYQKAKRFKPALLGELITSRYTELAGFREDLGVDRYFYYQAKNTRKPVLGLETIRDQARVLSDDSSGEARLVEAIASLPAAKEVLDQLVDAWKDGRINTLDRLLNQDEWSDPKSFESMFLTRNQKWLPQIERFLTGDSNYLVIVGSGHLVGDHGLVRALQERGYQVKQL
ncbi:MAG: TraB/GumN family protein [Chthoniobacterales bacterium]